VRIANEAIRVGSGAATASPRERAYVEAVGGLVAEGILPDWHDRTLAYEQAMGAIFQRYPEDREAAIFYALALNMATRPSDRSYAKQTRATELLLVALGDQPNHPGIIHYLTYCVGDASAVARDATPSQGIGMSTRTRRILLIGLAPLLIGGVSWLALLGSAWAAESAAAPIGGPFTLKSGGGQTVSDRDFRGKWLLVYTQCPDVCPTTLAEIAQTLQKLGPLAAEVQPIFITIDPERDTPEAVREYVEAFDPRLVGLTGTPGEIATVAKEYRVYYKRQAGKNAADYLMEHSAFVYVIDPAGKYATLFAPRGGQGPDQMAQRLRELIAQGPRH
jgi:protein SCO1/2